MFGFVFFSPFRLLNGKTFIHALCVGSRLEQLHRLSNEIRKNKEIAPLKQLNSIKSSPYTIDIKNKSQFEALISITTFKYQTKSILTSLLSLYWDVHHRFPVSIYECLCVLLSYDAWRRRVIHQLHRQPIYKKCNTQNYWLTCDKIERGDKRSDWSGPRDVWLLMSLFSAFIFFIATQFDRAGIDLVKLHV